MRAEIIAIGDELITGQRLDTNTQWISQRLVELGFPVAYHTTVGDCLEDNVNVLHAAIERADVVVLTGGLGPTADDLTRESVAAATDTELIRDQQEVARIRALFTRRGRDMPDSNAVQADLPAGAKAIPNPHGTAPGIEMHIARKDQSACRLFALPGVPAEMFAMWSESVRPALRAAQPTQRMIKHYRLLCFGVGESHLEAMLPNLIRRGREPSVGITVSDAIITLRTSAVGQDEADCLRALQPTLTLIREKLGTLVFGEEEDRLEDAVVRLLVEKRQRVAVAEWGTGGLVTRWLSAADHQRTTWAGGLVLSSLEQWNSWFQGAVLPRDIEPDSRKLATHLAESVRVRTGADYGLGIAAMPSADRESADRLHIALATPGRTRHFRFHTGAHPAIRQTRAALQALNVLRLSIDKSVFQ
ncbi:MAG: CinA family nicotinamide mononucleotide deamidase-related protein [Pirellulales bacterium]